MSLVALSLVGTTVHFWNVLYTFFFFFLGISGWIADPARAKVKAKVRAVDLRFAPQLSMPQPAMPVMPGAFAGAALPPAPAY